MTAKTFGLLSVVLSVGLIATCGGGGGPTQPNLEQAAAPEATSSPDGSGPDSGPGALPRCPTPGNPTKVQICHIPPGNPDNLRELCVGESAVPAHLAHGDYLGECLDCTPGEPYCCPPGDPYCDGGSG